MARKSTTVLKQRMKNLRKLQSEKTNERTIDTNKEDRIKELKSRIVNCEADLKRPEFVDNPNILNKLICLKSNLEELEKENVE